MSHYWKKCPYCGRVVEDGYGSPGVELGNPYRVCKHCFSRYKDRYVIEWESASVFKKFLFYIGNGRLLGSAFASFVLFAFLEVLTNLRQWATITISISVFILLFGVCLFIARHRVKSYLGITKPLKLTNGKTLNSRAAEPRKEYTMLMSKRVAVIVSLLLCAVLYLSFLFAFSTTRDTYICYTTKTGECFHSSICRYASNSAYETTVYEACRNYKPCNYCNPCVEKYKTTVTVRDYITPIVISIPTSTVVFILLTIGKKKEKEATYG